MKRADKLIQTTTYTRETAPAICALVDFAAQNPRLEVGNYFSPYDSGSNRLNGIRAFNSEKRSITADFRRFAEALAEASAEGVTDADVIAEAPHAFSGRLEWKTIRTGADYKLTEAFWSYCTSQYFPTEYRKAAATVLEYATRKVRASRPPRKQMPRTIAELKALNRENGGCWFDAGSMRFFGTRIESGIIRGNRFVTSEQPPHGSRAYSVRTFDEEGNIGREIGEFCGYSTRREALEAARTAPDPQLIH